MADHQASKRQHNGSPTGKKHQGGLKTSPKGGRSKYDAAPVNTSSRRTAHQIGRGGKLPHAVRRPRSGCYNPEVRKGVGAVLFALGVPAAIAGIVMTVVAATDDDQNGKYPPAFSTVGPVLLVCAFLLFLTGFSLINPVIPNTLEHCLSFDDPSSCCRVHCPRLSNCLKPDPTGAISQAAMDALKTEPGKSALKKPTGPPRPPDESDSFAGILSKGENGQNVFEDAVSQSQGSGGHPTAQFKVLSETKARRTGLKGVRFSESDVGEEVHRARTVSTSSDSSLLSLRHCKIYPKDDGNIWWTDDHIPEEWQDKVKELMTTEL